MGTKTDFEILKGQLSDFQISRNTVKEKIQSALIVEKDRADKKLASNINVVLSNNSLLEKLTDIKLLNDIYGFLGILVGPNIDELNCFFALSPYKKIFSRVGYIDTRNILYEKAGFSIEGIDEEESKIYKNALNVDIHVLLQDLDAIRNFVVPKRVVRSNGLSDMPSNRKSFIQ